MEAWHEGLRGWGLARGAKVLRVQARSRGSAGDPWTQPATDPIVAIPEACLQARGLKEKLGDGEKSQNQVRQEPGCS